MMRGSFIRSLAILTVLGLGTVTISGCAKVSAESIQLQSDREVVVVLHGLGRSPSAMQALDDRLQDAGYQVVRIGYNSLDDTPDQILAQIRRQIDACCIGKTPKVHFVGHSLGGLLIRAYLAETDVPNQGQVVLMGSPNAGTALVDNLRDRWWFDWLGPTADALGTGPDSFPNSLARPDYSVGVIAGHKDDDNDDLLPGEDDGLVTVESTKVEGMADFILLNVGHSAMRYDEDVAGQVIHFLEKGHFLHS